MPAVHSHDGVPLYYDIHDYTDPWKNAPTLILQHGFGRSGRFWYNIIPYLARFYKVLCPTARGLGDHYVMKDPEKFLNMENYIRDLVTIVDHLGLEKVHFAGEFMGGIIGMFFSALHPTRVRTLSLFSSPLFISPESKKKFSFGHATQEDALKALGVKGWSDALNTPHRFPADTDSGMLAWFSNEMAKSNLDVAIAMSRLGSKADATPMLEMIQAPVLGLYPTSGVVTSRVQFDTMKAKIRNLRLVYLKTTFHMVHMLEPANCAKHVLYFCSEYDGIPCREM